MAQSIIKSPFIAGISTCVPNNFFDNVNDAKEFPKSEIRKVVSMAGVSKRPVADENTCSSDLCFAAAEKLLNELGWERNSIDGLIMVTQTPDYFLPSSSCLIHQRLGLSRHCATYDVGLGCSGYPYGLWLASMMIESGGLKRVLLLHGETPSRFTDKTDRAVYLLFSDAGSATALEKKDQPSKKWFFTLNTDGAGYDGLIIKGGGFRDRFCADKQSHFVKMNGAAVFNFTVKAVPPLIQETLNLADISIDDLDYYIFHQSNRFIIKHLTKKCRLPEEKVPMILNNYGNSGGPSVPLTITQSIKNGKIDSTLKLMLLGYGVGLSWGAALVNLEPETVLLHEEWESKNKEDLIE